VSKKKRNRNTERHISIAVSPSAVEMAYSFIHHVIGSQGLDPDDYWIVVGHAVELLALVAVAKRDPHDGVNTLSVLQGLLEMRFTHLSGPDGAATVAATRFPTPQGSA
jgi:hypothetical protein